MPEPSPLELATTDELIFELQRRMQAMVIIYEERSNSCDGPPGFFGLRCHGSVPHCRGLMLTGSELLQDADAMAQERDLDAQEQDMTAYGSHMNLYGQPKDADAFDATNEEEDVE